MEKRHENLLNILLSTNESITISELANSLNVSKRTVRYDLDNLESYLSNANLELVRKPGIGVYIEGDDKYREELLENIRCKIVSKDIEEYSPTYRRKYILKQLLLSNRNITAKNLAEELFVSINTIYKDLDKLEEELSDLNLDLQRERNNLNIEGEESNYREAVFDIIPLIDHIYFNNDLENNKSDVDRIDYDTYVKLKKILDIDYNFLENALENIEEKLNIQFTDIAFTHLVTHIAIAIHRVKEGFSIYMPDQIFEEISKTDEYFLSKELGDMIEEKYDIKLPELEIGYISLRIMGSKNILDEEVIISSKEVDKFGTPGKIAEEIIEFTSDLTNIDLSHDKILLSGLTLHLRPSVNRILYDLPIDNPLLEEIKKQYPEIYGIAWMTDGIFKKYLNKGINDSEAGYIAMHLGAALERNKEKIKTVVVCNTGIGTSEVLHARLEKEFPDLELIDVLSYANLMEYDGEVDLIISTTPLDIDSPYILVRALLGDEDINLINATIDKIYKERYNKWKN